MKLRRPSPRQLAAEILVAGVAGAGLAAGVVATAPGCSNDVPVGHSVTEEFETTSVDCRRSILRPVATDGLALTPVGFEVAGARIESLEASGKVRAVPLHSLALDRQYRYGSDRGLGAVLPGTGMKHQGVLSGFRWDDEDQSTKAWYPQGITTSFDAVGGTGKVDGRRWTVVSWHAEADVAARLSFVDVTNPRDPGQARYGHVLLVEPDGQGGVQPVRSHAGGVTWFGNYLYVAQTHGGFRVFDLRHLWKVEDPSVSPDGSAYVLPQVGVFRSTGSAGADAAPPRFSGSSLDRSGETPALLSQEYDLWKEGGRIIRWPLDPETGSLDVSARGEVPATNAWAAPVRRLAGVAVVDDKIFFGTMGMPGWLYVAEPGERVERVDNLARGIQQFAYDGSGPRELVTLTEHPHQRAVWWFDPQE